MKNLADGGTLDVEELDLNVWAPRMLDDKASLKVWKRTGTNPVAYNGDTFYSEDDAETLRPLTAEAINTYWDEKYPDFERSGSPNPMMNCEDYAKGGSDINYRDGVTYDLGKESDRDSLKVVLDDGRHVLQLGAVKLTAHFLVVESQGGGNVKISQKDGDSAIYQRVMSSTDAVGYIRGKHSTVVELHRV